MIHHLLSKQEWENILFDEAANSDIREAALLELLNYYEEEIKVPVNIRVVEELRKRVGLFFSVLNQNKLWGSDTRNKVADLYCRLGYTLHGARTYSNAKQRKEGRYQVDEPGRGSL